MVLFLFCFLRHFSNRPSILFFGVLSIHSDQFDFTLYQFLPIRGIGKICCPPWPLFRSRYIRLGSDKQCGVVAYVVMVKAWLLITF